MKNGNEGIAATESAQTPPTLNPGRTLGRWHVSRLIGRGGMAEVYEVEDSAMGSRYALKLFTYDRGDVESARMRFFAEGRLLAQLAHPRLVRVYDFGEDDVSGRPYFVMELVLGEDGQPHTLADADVAGVDEDTVATWYEDIREGLAYIHGKGILHRDLKLQNILIGPDGHAVLSDFGVAKIFSPDLREKLGLTPEQTIMAVKGGQQTVMGSMGYMAPEIEMGVPASKESDWYALGVIVFRLLTGVWCDSRTDILGDLETYSPVWRSILPKLLHSNPAGRACPDIRVIEKACREEESYRIETELEQLRAKRHAAVRGRRNAWIVATGAILAAAMLVCLVLHGIGSRSDVQPLDFDSVVRIPPDAREESFEGEGGLPSRGQFAIARIDAWVLTHDLFADLNAGKITREKAVDELSRIEEVAKSDELALFEPMSIGHGVGYGIYSQLGETAPLVYLIQSAISNLTSSVRSR